VVKNSNSKKETILKTAARLFSTQGFDAATTLQPAGEAGVTEPLINYYFSGKNEFFPRLIETILAKYFIRIDELEQRTGSAFEQIRRLIELQFDVIDEMPDEVHLIAGACPARLNDPDGICARGIREFQKRRLIPVDCRLGSFSKCHSDTDKHGFHRFGYQSITNGIY